MGILNDAIARELGFFRAEATARMTSRCTIRRRNGLAAQDESTGLQAPNWDVIHTDLPIRLAGITRGAANSQFHTADGIQWNSGLRTGHFPWDTADLADGDFVELTAGENAGTVWRILEVDWQDQATAHRLPVQAEKRPQEWT